MPMQPTTVICKITRPEGWTALDVEIRLQGPIKDDFEGYPLTFPVPFLADRFLRANPKFIAAPAAGERHWRGRFVSGRWKGIIQTNGCSEKRNRTPISVIRASLIATVLKRLGT